MSTIKTAYEVLKVAHLAQDSVLLEGPHGIGKSDVVQTFSDDTNKYMFPLFLSTQETGDLIGIPTDTIVDGETVTTWSKPTWLKQMEMKAAMGIESVLFLDELNRAPLDVRQSALQLVLEGKIHEHSLPVVNGRRTMVVSAINPADDYQVQELDPALLDRFLCLTLKVSAPEWLDWARNNKVTQAIRDFVSEFPDRLHYTPKEGKGPTPRAWAALSRLLDSAKELNTPKSALYDIISGRLGSEVGSQFFGYYENYTDVIKVDDIEDFIVKADKNQPIEELGELIKQEFGEIEAIRKHEIVNELVQRHISKDSETGKIALAYIYSLDMEIKIAFLKNFRGEDNDRYTVLANLDSEVNNKELFRQILKASLEANGEKL